MFIHLRTQSSYSFLRGLAAPEALARAAAAEGLPALGLTDHHSLTGAVEFYDACHAAGVQPVLGLEVNIAGPVGGVLTLLAQDLAGWGSLCRVASALNGDDDSLPVERLAEQAAGLLCLTGGRRGALARLLADGQDAQAAAWLGPMRAIFADRLYVELQRHTAADQELSTALAGLAAQAGLPVVATHDVHYLQAAEAALQRVVSAIRTIRPLDALSDELAAPPGAYFVSAAEMAARWPDLPAALAATVEIAGRCRVELPVGVPHFPALAESGAPGAASDQALAVLKAKAIAGARRLYRAGDGAADDLPPAVVERLEHEFGVIEACGYAALFLIVEDILGYARRQGVPISSRGSAASSLVAHCLGLTSPDPLRLNLYFERFLNPARATPPDIDTDLCSRRRDAVIRYVYERFGAERVATVCTINRFRRRSALRETAKAHGLPPEEVSALADSLPQRWYGPPDRLAAPEVPYAELAEQYRSPRHQAIFRDAAALIGLPHHLSVHPGGVVIAPGPLTDLAPTTMAAKGVVITQFDLEAIERLGLVKIDLLGIRGLTVLGDVAESINSPEVLRTAKPSATLQDLLESISEDDPAVREAIRNGRTIGCFQIESPGMRATLKEIQAQSVDDIMAALALYRPGPLTGGLKDAFVRRHRGKEAPAYLHPALEPLLADTYGVILYQEQVLRVAHGLAGLSLADADLLRRAMSHFDPGKQMQTLQEKFTAGALAVSGVPAAIATRVWEQMAAFAGYGFPKAHAASYAQVAWRSAWCKVHYPAQFIAAVLANWGGYYSQRVYLTEARRLGLKLRPPHVNYAGSEFSVQEIDGQPTLFMGLDQIRDLTRRTQQRIIQERPFRSLMDFLARVDPRPVEAENLARVGALEGFGPISALLRQLAAGGWRGGQMPLFTLDAPAAEDDWPLADKVAAQEALLGVGVIAHPLELAAAQIATAGALTTVEAAGRLGQRVRVAGMRQTWRRSRTISGDYIYFMAMEDLEGMLEVVIAGNVYRAGREALKGPGPYLLEGTVELDREKGEPFIRAERVGKLVDW
jgi:DNA-directed DNA polymerase III PolC